MGPVISAHSRSRIEALIERGEQAGARVLVDGRGARIEGCGDGFFVKPTVLAAVAPSAELARTEVFGPVLAISEADSLDQAIAQVNASAYGNMACLFTSSGAAAIPQRLHWLYEDAPLGKATTVLALDDAEAVLDFILGRTGLTSPR